MSEALEEEEAVDKIGRLKEIVKAQEFELEQLRSGATRNTWKEADEEICSEASPAWPSKGALHEVLFRTRARVQPSAAAQAVRSWGSGSTVELFAWDQTRNWRLVLDPVTNTMVWTQLRHPRIGPLLSPKGLPFMYQPREPICDAARENQESELKRFISEGDDVNICDANGYTPLMYAAEFGHSACLHLLLRAGAKVSPSMRWTVDVLLNKASTEEEEGCRVGGSCTSSTAPQVAGPESEKQLVEASKAEEEGCRLPSVEGLNLGALHTVSFVPLMPHPGSEKQLTAMESRPTNTGFSVKAVCTQIAKWPEDSTGLQDEIVSHAKAEKEARVEVLESTNLKALEETSRNYEERFQLALERKQMILERERMQLRDLSAHASDVSNARIRDALDRVKTDVADNMEQTLGERMMDKLEAEQPPRAAVLQKHQGLLEQISVIEEDRVKMRAQQDIVLQDLLTKAPDGRTAAVQQSLRQAVQEAMEAMLEEHHKQLFASKEEKKEERRKMQAEKDSVVQELEEYRSQLSEAHETHKAAIQMLENKIKQLESEETATGGMVQKHDEALEPIPTVEEDSNKIHTDKHRVLQELAEAKAALLRPEASPQEKLGIKRDRKQKFGELAYNLAAEQAARAAVLQKHQGLMEQMSAIEEDRMKMQAERDSVLQDLLTQAPDTHKASIQQHGDSLRGVVQIAMEAILKDHEARLQEEQAARRETEEKLDRATKSLEAQRAKHTAMLKDHHERFSAAEDERSKIQAERDSVVQQLEECRLSVKYLELKISACEEGRSKLISENQSILQMAKAHEAHKDAAQKHEASLHKERAARCETEQKLEGIKKNLEIEQAENTAKLQEYHARVSTAEDERSKMQEEKDSVVQQLDECRASAKAVAVQHGEALERISASERAKINLESEVRSIRQKLSEVHKAHKVAIQKHELSLHEERAARREAEEKLERVAENLEVAQAAKTEIKKEYLAMSVADEERRNALAENRNQLQKLAEANETYRVAVQRHEASWCEEHAANREIEQKLEHTARILEGEQALKTAMVQEHQVRTSAAEAKRSKMQEEKDSAVQQLEEYRASAKAATAQHREALNRISAGEEAMSNLESQNCSISQKLSEAQETYKAAVQQHKFNWSEEQASREEMEQKLESATQKLEVEQAEKTVMLQKHQLQMSTAEAEGNKMQAEKDSVVQQLEECRALATAVATQHGEALERISASEEARSNLESQNCSISQNLTEVQETYNVAVREHELSQREEQAAMQETQQRLEHATTNLENEQLAKIAMLQEHQVRMSAAEDESSKIQAEKDTVAQELEEYQVSFKAAVMNQREVWERMTAGEDARSKLEFDNRSLLQKIAEARETNKSAIRKHEASLQEEQAARRETEQKLEHATKQLEDMSREHEASLRKEQAARRETEQKLIHAITSFDVEQAAHTAMLQEHHERCSAAEDERSMMQAERGTVVQQSEESCLSAKALELHIFACEEGRSNPESENHQVGLHEEQAARREMEGKLECSRNHVEVEQAAQTTVLQDLQANMSVAEAERGKMQAEKDSAEECRMPAETADMLQKEVLERKSASGQAKSKLDLVRWQKLKEALETCNAAVLERSSHEEEAARQETEQQNCGNAHIEFEVEQAAHAAMSQEPQLQMFAIEVGRSKMHAEKNSAEEQLETYRVLAETQRKGVLEVRISADGEARSNVESENHSRLQKPEEANDTCKMTIQKHQLGLHEEQPSKRGTEGVEIKQAAKTAVLQDQQAQMSVVADAGREEAVCQDQEAERSKMLAEKCSVAKYLEECGVPAKTAEMLEKELLERKSASGDGEARNKLKLDNPIKWQILTEAHETCNVGMLEGSLLEEGAEQAANAAMSQEPRVQMFTAEVERSKMQAENNSVVEQLEGYRVLAEMQRKGDLEVRTFAGEEDRSKLEFENRSLLHELFEAHETHKVALQKHEANLHEERVARQETEEKFENAKRKFQMKEAENAAILQFREMRLLASEGEMDKISALKQEMEQQRTSAAEASKTHQAAIQKHEATLQAALSANRELEQKLEDKSKQLQKVQVSAVQERQRNLELVSDVEEERNNMQAEKQSVLQELAEAHEEHEAALSKLEVWSQEELRAKLDTEQKFGEAMDRFAAEQAAEQVAGAVASHKNLELLEQMSAIEEERMKMRAELDNFAAEQDSVLQDLMTSFPGANDGAIRPRHSLCDVVQDAMKAMLTDHQKQLNADIERRGEHRRKVQAERDSVAHKALQDAIQMHEATGQEWETECMQAQAENIKEHQECMLAREELIEAREAHQLAIQDVAREAHQLAIQDVQAQTLGSDWPSEALVHPFTSIVNSTVPPSPWPLFHAVGSHDDVCQRRFAGAEAEREAFLHYDAFGVLRGQCKGCSNCKAWQVKGFYDIHWRNEQRNTSHIVERVCNICGCLDTDHADLTEWRLQVRARILEFRNPMHTNRMVPRTYPLPIAALDWTHTDTALYVLSSGRFDPRSHGRTDNFSNEQQSDQQLISVCIPTSTRRHHLHPLLYANFQRQDYESRELVVIDTGRVPSAFLQEQARTDPRVTYRWFPVEDAKQDQAAANSKHVFRYLPEKDTWSLGFKRNVAVHLARGPIIAHFDDDDLYSPNYLSYMKEELMTVKQAAQQKAQELAGPAIVTLSAWHTFDYGDQSFHLMDPETDPSTPPEWKEDMIYGYGFSYMYTRAAWKVQVFPDLETGEDDVFMEELRHDAKTHVKLVQLPKNGSGLVAHGFHGRNTGVMEFNGTKRLGTRLSQVPRGFADLLPIVDTLGTK